MVEILSHSEEEPQLDSLNRETPLTIQEISQARSEEVRVSGSPFPGKKRNYQFGDLKVSILRKQLDPDEFPSEKHKEQVLDIIRSKEAGEAADHEKLLVNVLVEQARIAKKFGIPQTENGLFSGIVLDYTSDAKHPMMDDTGIVYMLPLAEHINSLKKQGVSEAEIITEISGHLFHEGIHCADSDVKNSLLGGKIPPGEISSITAQLAYYLEEGYKGPKSYDNRRLLQGIKKIKNGGHLEKDHDIATCVSAELLLGRLRETYPEIAESNGDMTALDACENIVARLSPQERDRLIPCLKEAILQSTDVEKFKEVLERIKQENQDK